MKLRSLIAIFLFTPVLSVYAKAMYPVPTGALELRHVTMQPGVYEQDSFVLDQPYPTTAAIEHYERVFAKWKSCSSKKPQWESFGDRSGREPRFQHQLIRHWLNHGNNIAITVALRYTSAGAEHRANPDNTQQNVYVLRHKTGNAKNALAQIGVACD